MQSSRKTAKLISPAYPWLKPLLLTGWCVIGAASFLIAISSLQDMPLLQMLLAPLEVYVHSEKAKYSPLAYFCLLSLVAYLEMKIPARRQALLTPSLAQDALWYVGSLLFRITFLAGYSAVLFGLYHNYLEFLTIEAAADWHPAIRFVVAILVTDFVRWLSHLIIHKVPVFWEFHAVHHSQADLNLFTDARVHPVDRMIATAVKFIPMLMLGNALTLVIAWAVFDTVYPKFYHANVRLNFGPLRYILVTPQSHRVHHGVDIAYRDKNFGFTFSIWDWIFGTQYRDPDTYPETGIEDKRYPHERSAGPFSLVKTFFWQLLYPFQRLARMAKR